jgi:hypothetical protein
VLEDIVRQRAEEVDAAHDPSAPLLDVAAAGRLKER